MAYCPKCGNKVDETMTFCPRCGASLKMESTSQAAPAPTYPPAPVHTRNEKQEKNEKREKQEKQGGEKGEKHEKGGHGFIGWMIAGLFLIFIGFVWYTDAVYQWVPRGRGSGAFWILAIGIIIIVAGIYFAMRARKNYPPPS